MATSASKTAGPKPSFASVAARAPPPRCGPVINSRDNDRPTKSSSPVTSRLSKPPMADSPSASQLHRELHISMAQLDVKDSPPASNTLNEHAKSNIKRAGLRLDDDQIHVSSNSTKAASLDGKSTTSGTTFALDEKESLRPDDSASVQAVDDDDFGSGLASGAPNSRMGSEAGSRAFRDQFFEVSENNPGTAPRSHPLSRRVIADIEEEGPQMTHNPIDSTLAAPIASHHNIPAVARPSIDFEHHRDPDEKLFEALDSPKDRMFLLRLEQDIIDFVKNSTEPTLILPPCNSFCRLLAHKLADYYALTHYVDNAVAAVTLYRTPYCRIPTPLGVVAKSHGLGSNTIAPPTQPAMKIMRRPGLGKDGQTPNSGAGTTESSVAPSKAGSETGEESLQGTGAISPTESTFAKERAAMTRAEREARYKEKREELFGPQNEVVDSNEAINELSRTSSRNEEKKRKKKHKNVDDGFEARSQFNAYYPTMQYAVNQYDQTSNPAAYFSPYTMQASHSTAQGQANFTASGMFQQNLPNPFQNMLPAQNFQPAVNQMPMMSGYPSQTQFQGYDQQTPTQYFAVMQPPMAMIPQPSTMVSSAMSAGPQLSPPQSQMSDQQQWSQNGFAYPYPQPQPREQQQFFPQAVPSAPYQFGQLPYQPPSQSGKVQHPLPGSFTRQQTFNPQTRAFIPNGSSGHPRSPPHGNSPSTSSNHSPAMHFTNGGQFAQAPTYFPIPTSNHNASHEYKTKDNRKSATQTNGTHSPLPNSLSKWGTPANLPAKPPPPETPNMPNSLPMNNHFSAHVQPMSAGQPMPHYQNGVYSMPGASH
ncbi:MAG: hypothetical protein Q9164_005612 [Protoblastenia rupestris]